jgi:hypothetical protein
MSKLFRLDRLRRKKVKETLEVEQELGLIFQDRIAALPEAELPERIHDLVGSPGLLMTNENLAEDLVERIQRDERSPDGYVFGAGFGNILSMLLMYPADRDPKALLCADVLPEVVLTGRMFVNLLATKPVVGFDAFWHDRARNEDLLRSCYDKAVLMERNQIVQDRFKELRFDDVHRYLEQAVSFDLLPFRGLKLQKGDPFERIAVIAVIRDRFEQLTKMAEEGRIGIAFADITNPKVIEVAKNMPGFLDLKNIVYLSNIVDHITMRGTRLENLGKTESLRALEEGRQNWFVDTTQRSCDYQLRAGHRLPKYSNIDV